MSHKTPDFMRQRRMGVEPTRDRAERPPSRFEDGETHRGPYTSISFSMPYCAMSLLSCQANLLRLNISPLACFCAPCYTNKRGTTSSPDLPQISLLASTSSYSSTTRGTT